MHIITKQLYSDQCLNTPSEQAKDDNANEKLPKLVRKEGRNFESRDED